MIKLTILLLYFLAAGLLIHAHNQHSENGRRRLVQGGLTAVMAALLMHAWLLSHALFASGDLRIGLGGVVGILALQVGLFAFVAAAWTRLRGLGALLMPLAGAAVLFIMPARPESLPEAPGWQIQSHIILSLLSYGFFTLAALLALLMRGQERAIRRGRPGEMLRLMPPLEAAEQALFLCTGIGFFLLSLGIFSGLVFVQDFFAQHLVHKTALSIFGWLIFGALLAGRWRFGWRGETAAAWTLGGFATLVLAYFGSRFVLEVLLGRQWG